jgi:integrase
MKAGKAHVVPLTAAATAAVLQGKPGRDDPGRPLFGENGRPLSNMAMSALLRRMKRNDITVHGFRSSFRDWAGDATEYPRELIEQALAHTITNRAEAAYRRGRAIERRRKLMEDWARFLSASTTG